MSKDGLPISMDEAFWPADDGEAGERADAIPEAAVEKAAEALRRVINSYAPQWDRRIDWFDPSYVKQSVVDAQVVLDAARPFLRAAQPEAGSEEGERLRLTVDWTEDGQGIVLDTRTNPAKVIGTHDLPYEALRAARSEADRARDDPVQKAWDEGRHPFGPGTGQAITQAHYEADRAPEDENCPDCWEGRPKWAGTMPVGPCPTCNGTGKLSRAPEADRTPEDEAGRRYYPTMLHGEEATAARLAEHADRAPSEVETVARAIYDSFDPLLDWDTRQEAVRENFRTKARTVLTALDAVRGRSRDDTVTLAEALHDAISRVGHARVGVIGTSRVYTPQINVEAVERWREALARFGASRAEDEPPPATARRPGEVETVARAANPAYDSATHDETREQWRLEAARYIAALDAVRGRSPAPGEVETAHEAGVEAARQALCSGKVDFSPPSFGGDRRKAAELAVDAYLDAVRGRSRDCPECSMRET